MTHFLIKVNGEIKTTDAYPQYAVNWACGSLGGDLTNPDFKYDRQSNVVDSDLTLCKTIRAVPYAVYYTEHGICSNDGDIFSCGKGIKGAYSYFEETTKEIRTQLDIDIDDRISVPFYNGLYLEVASALELFLCDAILSLMYTDDNIYDNAVEYYKNKQRKAIIDVLPGTLHNYFFKIVYHRFDVVKDIFLQLIGCQIPDTAELKIMMRRRHNIVHRASLASDSRMLVTNANKECTMAFLDETISFVTEIYKLIQTCLK